MSWPTTHVVGVRTLVWDVYFWSVFPLMRRSPRVLSERSLLEHTDITVMLDSEALNDICRRDLDIELPTYTKLNCLLAQIIFSFTASLRFDEALNVDITQFPKNCEPNQRLHFVLCSCQRKMPHRRRQRPRLIVFERASMMVECDSRHGEYRGLCFMYRSDVVPKVKHSLGHHVLGLQMCSQCRHFCLVPLQSRRPLFEQGDTAPRGS